MKINKVIKEAETFVEFLKCDNFMNNQIEVIQTLIFYAKRKKANMKEIKELIAEYTHMEENGDGGTCNYVESGELAKAILNKYDVIRRK